MNTKETVKQLLAKDRFDFQDLTDIMQILRADGGCPWDIEQTHKSIRGCMIEEAYEVVEAIDNEDPKLLREELGDVLFQVIFHSQIEQEAGRFDVSDVVHDICVKMIHRHPHVFADSEIHDPETALSRWESIKTEEKQRNTLSSRLRAIPPMLPALMRAAKVAKKAGATEGKNTAALLTELSEQAASLAAQPKELSATTLGELLFTVAKLSANTEIDAEAALSGVTDRLIDKVAASEAEKRD